MVIIDVELEGRGALNFPTYVTKTMKGTFSYFSLVLPEIKKDF